MLACLCTKFAPKMDHVFSLISSVRMQSINKTQSPVERVKPSCVSCLSEKLTDVKIDTSQVVQRPLIQLLTKLNLGSERVNGHLGYKSLKYF